MSKREHCSVCALEFVALSGGAQGCVVHGIRKAITADHILRCVNAHDALVSALQRIEQAATNRETRLGDPCGLIEVRDELEAAAKQARAALALAGTAGAESRPKHTHRYDRSFHADCPACDLERQSK